MTMFIEKDAASMPSFATYEALVIAADIGGFEVEHVLVANGSSANVLYYDAFRKMGSVEMKLTLTDARLIRFNGGCVYPLGAITLTSNWKLMERPYTVWQPFWLWTSPQLIMQLWVGQRSMCSK